MDENKLKSFFATNYRASLEDIDLFIEAIPHVAKMIGVDTLREKIGMSKSQYYSRVNKKYEWSLSELKKILEIFIEFKILK